MAERDDERVEGENVLPPAVVDCALYEHGRRLPGRTGLEKILHRTDPGGSRFAWIGLYEPTAEQFQHVADAFDLHSWRSRTPSTPISGPSWNATATPSSSC
ncbi:hypothetical protein GCM10023097_19940 [Streptomyces collinus]|uniref:Magnesium and cobalt transport protein CorA n=1 Tax=Streptomyces collinus TaxID=42684 RepID=A0AA89TJU6_STRCU|nr:hypothetical protein [Streptomyces collinus]